MIEAFSIVFVAWSSISGQNVGLTSTVIITGQNVRRGSISFAPVDTDICPDRTSDSAASPFDRGVFFISAFDVRID